MWANIQGEVNNYGLQLLPIAELFFYIGIFIAVMVPLVRGRQPGFGMPSLPLFMLALFAPIFLLMVASVFLRAGV
jgi:heme/copper-type cytochrome/quinol oxidase subunit 1